MFTRSGVVMFIKSDVFMFIESDVFMFIKSGVFMLFVVPRWTSHVPDSGSRWIASRLPKVCRFTCFEVLD